MRTKGVISLEKAQTALSPGVIGYGGGFIQSLDELPLNWDADFIFHEGLESCSIQILIHDLDALSSQGLVHFRDDTQFFLTPLGIKTEASLKESKLVGTENREVPSGLTQERPRPKVFISYTWESDKHKEWVRLLAEKLTADGVLITFDQWEAQPGDQLPQFMEMAVRENDFVLIICTPRYKAKSDSRIGGAGYEGDIMTAEIFNGGN